MQQILIYLQEKCFTTINVEMNVCDECIYIFSITCTQIFSIVI